MGLSDEERIAGIYHSTSTIVREANYILKELEGVEYRYDFKDIEELANYIKDNAWKTLLKGQSNSLYWIMGAESLGDVLNEKSLLDCAIISATQKEGNSPIHPEDFSKEEEQTWNRCQFFIDTLTPKNIINNPIKGSIYTINEHIENILYRINRYGDKLSKSLSGYEDFISNIRGKLFEIFKNDKDFIKTYLIDKIFNKIFKPYIGCGWDRNAECIFSKWFVSKNIHHSVRLISDYYAEENSIQNLLDIWKEIQFKKDIKQADKFNYCLKIVGERFHYDHEHKQLLEYLKKNKISTKKIAPILNNIKSKHKKTEEKNRVKYSTKFCYLTMNSG
jgi:hypothetical protein